jgi:putative FmdB family regulatory protein
MPGGEPRRGRQKDLSMPLFEYRCEECQKNFSLLEGVTAEKAKRVCPKCGSRKLSKLISQISPVAKGDDFDSDDFGDDDGELGDDYAGDDELD